MYFCILYPVTCASKIKPATRWYSGKSCVVNGVPNCAECPVLRKRCYSISRTVQSANTVFFALRNMFLKPSLSFASVLGLDVVVLGFEHVSWMFLTSFWDVCGCISKRDAYSAVSVLFVWLFAVAVFGIEALRKRLSLAYRGDSSRACRVFASWL